MGKTEMGGGDCSPLFLTSMPVSGLCPLGPWSSPGMDKTDTESVWEAAEPVRLRNHSPRVLPVMDSLSGQPLGRLVVRLVCGVVGYLPVPTPRVNS